MADENATLTDEDIVTRRNGAVTRASTDDADDTADTGDAGDVSDTGDDSGDDADTGA